jgi:hypothetical protein
MNARPSRKGVPGAIARETARALLRGMGPRVVAHLARSDHSLDLFLGFCTDALRERANT